MTGPASDALRASLRDLIDQFSVTDVLTELADVLDMDGYVEEAELVSEAADL